MYENIHIGIQNLRRPARIRPGGLCKIYFARRKDVSAWPPINHLQGVITDTITLVAGATLYIVEATFKDRTFKESLKNSAAGDYVEMQVTTSLPGNVVNHILGLSAMQNQDFVMIITDTDGFQRLIGNEDAGAVMTWDFTSGDSDSSRYRNLVWKYNHSLAAPVYNGGSVVLDDENFIFASLTFVARFRVRAEGSTITSEFPMNDGDTVYSNPLLANGNFIILSNGKAIHQLADSLSERYATKAFSSNTILITGGVSEDEVIEIYKF